MLSLNRNGYTKQQVIDILHGKRTTREISFRYDLLDSEDLFKYTLETVTNANVSMDSLAKIKRTATFRIKDDSNINWLSDRIQPFCLVKMSDGGFVEFPLGIFLLSSPKRKDENNQVYRDVEAYDGLVVLMDDKLESRLVLAKDSSFIQAIKDILTGAGITKINLENSSSTLSADLEFEAGLEKLEVVSELLKQINYNELYVDVEGFYTSKPFRNPSIRGADYSYKDDEFSVTYNGMEEELDLFNIPNKWVIVCSNADNEPFVSSYTNENPNSLTSTVNRKRTIVSHQEVRDIADQATLDEYAERVAFESSQVYGKVSFDTAIMPFHDYLDVLEINYSTLAIRGNYLEIGWSFPLEAGAIMKHNLQKVVSI